MTRTSTSLALVLFTMGIFSSSAKAEGSEPSSDNAVPAVAITYDVRAGEGVKVTGRTLKRLKKSLYRSLKERYPNARLSRGKPARNLTTCLANAECASSEAPLESIWILDDALISTRLSKGKVETVSLTQGRSLTKPETLGQLRFDEEDECVSPTLFVDDLELSCSLLKEKGIGLEPGAHVLKSNAAGSESSKAFLIEAQRTTRLSLAPIEALTKAPPLVAAPEQPAKRRALRLAVYDFDAGDIDPGVHKIFQAALVTELRKRQWLSVVSTSEIRAMLKHEADKQLLGCSDDTSCMSEIADALGVDALLVGNMATVGETHVLTLKRISQREAAVKGSVQRNVPADKGHGLLGEVGSVVDELFPKHALRPGATRGAAALFSERLSPPPLPKWVFYTASSVTTLAAFATGATAGALFINDNTRTTANEFPEGLQSDSPEFREIKSEVETGESTNRTLLIGTTVAVGVTLTAAISAGIFALLTDFDEEPDLDLDD